MDKKLYQTLVEQFAIYDQEDLKEILSDNESSEEAIAAAKYILSGESIEAKNFQSEIRKHETLIKFMLHWRFYYSPFLPLTARRKPCYFCRLTNRSTECILYL